MAITDGAHTFTCVDGALKRGTAVNDQACVDSPTAATPASEICRSDHVCLSTTTPGSFICRPMCTIGGTLCDGGRSCARLSAKGAPVGVDNLTFGACVGP